MTGPKAQKKWMRLALRTAYEGIGRLEGGPFGAVIIHKGKAVAVAHNQVLKIKDATCHAEINAIRGASRKLGRFDLSGCVIYSTTEPCPMCFAAIHWARISGVIYGTSIADVLRRGFNELSIPSRQMKKTGRSPVLITAGFLRTECLKLLRAWDQKEQKKVY